MDPEPESRWPQAFTFGGIAQFGRARVGQLWIWQLVVALLAALSLVAFVELDWVPVVNRTIAALPESGAIQDGKLVWPPAGPVRTAGSPFLWVSIDPTDSLEAGEGADLQLEFGPTELRARSLFGFLHIAYPEDLVVPLNRTELEPAWGAWHPAFAVGLGAAVVLGLMLAWWCLGLIYAWPIRLIAFYADRQLTWAGSWRVGAACLLPGALFFVAAMVAYTFNQINLLQFLGATALHLMIGWLYVLFAPFALTSRMAAKPNGSRRGNPFGGSPRKASNPFAGPRK